jgi:hypothetical protein
MGGGRPSFRLSYGWAAMLPAQLFRSTLPVVFAVVVPALRKAREGRGTRSCGGFCSLKAVRPAPKSVDFSLYFLEFTRRHVARSGLEAGGC